MNSNHHGWNGIDPLPTRQLREADLVGVEAVGAVVGAENGAGCAVFPAVADATRCGGAGFVGVGCSLVAATVAGEAWRIETPIPLTAGVADSSVVVVAVGIFGAAVAVAVVVAAAVAAVAVVAVVAARAARAETGVAAGAVATVGARRADSVAVAVVAAGDVAGAACTAESVVVAAAFVVAAAVCIATPFVLQPLVPLRLWQRSR